MSLVETIERMIEKDKESYNNAARMHSMSLVERHGARIEALEDVMKLLIGSIRR